MDSVSTITQVIGNLGFPIFVAIYMLIFTNNTLQKLNNTLSEIKRQNSLLISLLRAEPRLENRKVDDQT